jgi:hypothetical protein
MRLSSFGLACNSRLAPCARAHEKLEGLRRRNPGSRGDCNSRPVHISAKSTSANTLHLNQTPASVRGFGTALRPRGIPQTSRPSPFCRVSVGAGSRHRHRLQQARQVGFTHAGGTSDGSSARVSHFIERVALLEPSSLCASPQENQVEAHEVK